MLTVAERVARRVLNAQGLRSRWLTTSVGRVHALDGRGQGRLPPLVMLHGFSANAISCAGLIRRLAPHTRRVIAPDSPGHGFSDTPRGGLVREAMVAGMGEALDQVIDEAGEPVVLMGTSMGGFGAIRYAAERPDKVAALVLVCPGGAPTDAAEFQDFLDTFRIDRHAQALAFVDRMLVRSPQGFRHVLAHGIRKRFSHPELRRLLASMDPADMLSAAELRRLTMPTLLLWGRDELILPRSQLGFFREHMPAHAEIEEWANFGHCGFLERPEAVSRRVVRFARTMFRRRYQEAPARVSTHVPKRDTLRISA